MLKLLQRFGAQLVLIMKMATAVCTEMLEQRDHAAGQATVS
jgi:hypothetical protein